MILSHHRAKNIVGAIFPISCEHFENLVSTNRNVFAKFTNLLVKPNSLIVFYGSGTKTLIGDARTTNVERLDPNTAWTRYGSRLFLDYVDYFNYTSISPIGKEKRKMSKITVFELKKIRRYPKAIKPYHTSTPSGRYLTQEMFDAIQKGAA